MSEVLREKIRGVAHQIAALQEQKQRLEAQAADAPRWPKRLRLYAHRSKETNWEKGEALGLTGEALQLFVHFTEIELEVEVAEDGRCVVVACDGQPVQRTGETP